MAHDGTVPTKPQIERQLVKMLENETFTSRPQLARMLDCLVKRTLAGMDVTEKSIREELYPTRKYTKPSPEELSNPTRKYEEGSTVVRRTIHLLRKSLWNYYKENETEPLVAIYFPEQPPEKTIKFQTGEAYKLRFDYNVHHQVSKDYLLGCHYLASGYLNQIPDAVELFHKVLEREPDHAGAMLYMADAVCYMAAFGIFPERREDLIAWAGNLIDRATPYAAAFWHTHAARALVHYCRGEFDAAQQEFDKALTMDREQTELCSLYSLFLFANGRPSDALQLTEFMADEHVDSPVLHAIHGLHLATARRYDEAESAVQRALELDRNSWFAHLCAMRLHMARGRTTQAQEHAERMKVLLEPDEYEHWMAIIKALDGPA